MESSNQFTCLTYNTIDFLIQSKYILFGLYLKEPNTNKSAVFENEVLPHINIGPFLENQFMCKPTGESNTLLVMKKDDFDSDFQKLIVEYTGTAFPASGNFAISVNTAVSSRVMNIKILRLLPQGIRKAVNDYGVNAIAFAKRRQLLISPDNLLKKLMRCEK